MTFFIDENLGPDLARGMKGFGEDVIHLTERFPSGTTDTVWLRFVGDEGLVVVTRDAKLRSHPWELEALKTHHVGAFFLGGKKLGRCEIIRQVVRNWPIMKQLASATPTPYAFRVPPTGSISPRRDRIPL